MRDELKEGDQILVKVLALEGNKIKLSRKAILKEQREKLKTAKCRARAGRSLATPLRSRLCGQLRTEPRA